MASHTSTFSPSLPRPRPVAWRPTVDCPRSPAPHKTRSKTARRRRHRAWQTTFRKVSRAFPSVVNLAENGNSPSCLRSGGECSDLWLVTGWEDLPGGPKPVVQTSVYWWRNLRLLKVLEIREKSPLFLMMTCRFLAYLAVAVWKALGSRISLVNFLLFLSSSSWGDVALRPLVWIVRVPKSISPPVWRFLNLINRLCFSLVWPLTFGSALCPASDRGAVGSAGGIILMRSPTLSSPYISPDTSCWASGRAHYSS